MKNNIYLELDEIDSSNFDVAVGKLQLKVSKTI